MMLTDSMELRLVTDTNLFFECTALALLPWDELGSDSVVLLLTKPVLDEIDRHKRGSGRTRDRALDIFGRVRSMLETGQSESVIRPADPRVVLRLDPTRPDPGLADVLDYAKTDERLVGIVSALRLLTDDDVRLFTDDTGPAATASGLGVPYRLIDAGWRRPTADGPDARRNRELETELAAYRAQEPRIAIRSCEGADPSNRLEVTDLIAEPLTHDEVESILASLIAKHPPEREIKPLSPSSVSEPDGSVILTEYLAPTEEAVAQYRDVLHPAWVERCRRVLRKLHEGRDTKAPTLVVRWAMSNDGTRPATSVRVVFEARGPIRLLRLDDKSTGASPRAGATPPPAPQTPKLPLPPPAPPFRENVTRLPAPTPKAGGTPPPRGPSSSLPTRELGSELGRVHRSLGYLGASASVASLQKSLPGTAFVDAVRSARMPSIPKHVLVERFDALSMTRPVPHASLSLSPLLKPRHDAEAFYYADWARGEPARRGALTADLWRHQAGEETFEFEIVFERDGATRGAVECTVHAGNLTKPAQARVVVARTTRRVGVLDLAEALVRACD